MDIISPTATQPVLPFFAGLRPLVKPSGLTLYIVGDVIMAIFEKEKAEAKSYVAMLDAQGELVAFIQPVKGVSNELIKEALVGKGLNVEIREPKADIVSITL